MPPRLKRTTPNTRAALLASLCRRRSHHASLPLDARSRDCSCARARWAAHATWYSAARASAPAHGDSLTHGSNTRRQTRVQPCSPPSVADDHHASLPLDARSMHCGCARVRWAAHATWYSAARASTPAHGDSLTHGSNARRQTRVQPCLPCASPSVADDHHARACHTRCSIDALRLRTSEIGCSRYMALGRTCQGACPRCVIAPRLKCTTPNTRPAMLAVSLSPTTTTREPATLDARSMHCGCARVR